MKITLKIEKEFEVKTLHVAAGVRYWEDAIVNGIEDEMGQLIPCRNGDNWCPIIAVETGRILNWTHGNVADIHYKVCDDGAYTLVDERGTTICEKEGYVPEALCPKENGYGDYIIMNINAEGFIEGWVFGADEADEFNTQEE